MRLSLALAFLFFIGSCFGWVLELLYRNLTHRHKKWINPGFCTGPYLPIYGFGLCTLFLLASLEDLHLIADPVWNRVVLFIAMAVAMTLIEYIAGLALPEISESPTVGLFKPLGQYSGNHLPAVLLLLGGAWRGVLFSGASLYLECAGVVVQQSGVFLLHWYVLRRVHHRRGAFQPDHRQAEAVRRGKQGRREIREHQGPHPGFQPECRCQVSLFLPLPFGQPSGRALEGNVSQAGKAERQSKVNFPKPPRFLRRLFAGFWANGTKIPEENRISSAL